MKKIISLLICAFIIIAAAVPALAEGEDMLLIGETEAAAGDINLDGEANNKDVVTLFRYVSAGIKAEDESLYDFNGDAEVNNKDVVALFRYLSSTEQSEESSGPEETEEITVPDKTLTYVAADIYSDGATAEKEGYKKAGNNLLSKWFADKVELDPETWDPIAPAGFASVSEFVVRRSQGQYIEEVTVLKVKEDGSSEDVAAMAEFRREKEKNNADYTLYDDDDHRNAKMLNSGVVEEIGGFVVYIVTEDTETSVLRAKKFVQQNPDCTAAELYRAIVIEENS